MPAVNLALDDVNREKNLLPGFILKLHSNDSEVYEMFVEKFEKHRREITTSGTSLIDYVVVSVRARTRCLSDVQFTIL